MQFYFVFCSHDSASKKPQSSNEGFFTYLNLVTLTTKSIALVGTKVLSLVGEHFLFNFPLYYLPRCQGLQFLWTTYRNTDTIGGPPLTYSQQSAEIPPEITQDRTCLNNNLYRNTLWNNSPIQKNPTPEPEIEPGTSLSVRKDDTIDKESTRVVDHRFQ